jgi:hypothetical protein
MKIAQSLLTGGNNLQPEARKAGVWLDFQQVCDQLSVMIGERDSDMVSRLNQAELDRLAAQQNGTVGRHIEHRQSRGQKHADFTLHRIHVLDGALGALRCGIRVKRGFRGGLFT